MMREAKKRGKAPRGIKAPWPKKRRASGVVLAVRRSHPLFNPDYSRSLISVLARLEG